MPAASSRTRVDGPNDRPEMTLAPDAAAFALAIVSLDCRTAFSP
jgi:hypothetical protein